MKLSPNRLWRSNLPVNAFKRSTLANKEITMNIFADLKMHRINCEAAYLTLRVD